MGECDVGLFCWVGDGIVVDSGYWCVECFCVEVGVDVVLCFCDLCVLCFVGCCVDCVGCYGGGGDGCVFFVVFVVDVLGWCGVFVGLWGVGFFGGVVGGWCVVCK